MEVVAVSARTGAGLSDLRAALDRAAAELPSRAEIEAPARLHVDRVFTIRGAGTVVTGTLWAGQIGRGDELLVLPSGLRARVRGVQVHDAALERAEAGQRVAVNLTGVATDEVTRGDVLSAVDGGLAPTYLLDAELSFAEREPENGQRVAVHHGTREVPGRLAWLGGRFWQLRLERQLVPAAGDRLVIRQIAPPDTIGGGRVLDPRPRKHGPGRDLLARLERLARGEEISAPAPAPARAAVRAVPPVPEPPAPSVAPLSASALALAETLRTAGFEPPLDSALDVGDLTALREAGIAVRVSKTLHYHRDAIAEVQRRVLDLAARGDGSVTLAGLRDELGTSRKFAQALLEHFDAEKLTLRRGEAHVVRATALRRLG
jgi:selenocysteine-specific elongation factor